jgi:hypothetical protein
VYRPPLPSLLLSLALAACGGEPGKGGDEDSGPAPAEGTGGGDTPGQNGRLPDGEDNDCDGEIDEPGESERRTLLAIDTDGDGWSAGPLTMRCLGTGVALSSLEGIGDCDDTNPSIRPGGRELCTRRGDDDCDGLADCADPSCGGLDCAEDCHDGLDEDGDGDIDCADNSCRTDPTCDEVCSDGLDNDADGRADCADSDCEDEATCAEDCADGVDNDVDGLVDCADWECRSAGDCIEDCTDGLDNNRDGAADCRDPQCIVDPACVEDCDDGVDNDADGAIDCEEVSCASPTCAELCADRVDNDTDGVTDCADPDCFGPTCTEVCGDGFDNDADGRADCADPACAHPACAEDCDDEIDNNANGRTDCADWACRTDPWCVEDCHDGVDNDRNGLADCEDAACASICAEDCDGTDNDRDGLAGCDDPDCGLLIACWSALSVTVDAPTVRRGLVAHIDSYGAPYIRGAQNFAADRLYIQGVAHTAAGAPLPCAVDLVNLTVTGRWAEFGPRAYRGGGTGFSASAVAVSILPPTDPSCPMLRPGQVDPIIPARLASASATWAIFPGDGLDLLTLSQAVPGGVERTLLELVVASPAAYTVRPISGAIYPWERVVSQNLTGDLRVAPAP